MKQGKAVTLDLNVAAAEIVAIDPSPEQVSYAQSRKAAEGVQFQAVDARSMPFESGKFDVSVSALVLNFIPDREKAVSEMRRVVRPGGKVAAYVWDFASGKGTAEHLNSAVKELEGPAFRRAGLYPESTTQENLKSLFESAGLTSVETRPIEIPVTFRDFDDYWNSNTAFASPVGAVIKGYAEEKLQHLMQLVKTKLPIDSGGAISYAARVNAVRGST
jgi:SAM-dependent methyltransferase